MQQEKLESEILDILWQSLRGGDYDLEAMRRKAESDSTFEELGIDSLDMTDFFMRLEDRYQVKILQEDYPHLASVSRLRDFLAGGDRRQTPAGGALSAGRAT